MQGRQLPGLLTVGGGKRGRLYEQTRPAGVNGVKHAALGSGAAGAAKTGREPTARRG